MKFIKWFNEIRINDTALVGGKNASIGQMISQLDSKKIRIPNGFAITADAYWYFLQKNEILNDLKLILSKLKDYKNTNQLKKVSQQIRILIEEKSIPQDLEKEIIHSYNELSHEYKQQECDVAIRSSA